MGDEARVTVIVNGRVQGVGFRYFVKDTAQSLGLTGWVRNRWDDTVEVLAEGDRHKLEQLLAALKRGPRAAVVEDVQIEWLPYQGEFGGFNIKSTS